MKEEISVKPNEPILTATSYCLMEQLEFCWQIRLTQRKILTRSLSLIKFEKKAFAESCLDIIAKD